MARNRCCKDNETETRMGKSMETLERYLNDHLAGASGALLVIDRIIDSQDSPEAEEFFRDLKSKVEDDRSRLEELLIAAGLSPSLLLKATGHVSARFGLMKLMWEGMEPGELGMFEALELLSLGIQGKRLLWLALHEIGGLFPEWSDFDFAALELDAIRQRDEVERWRIEAAVEALPGVEKRRSLPT